MTAQGDSSEVHSPISKERVLDAIEVLNWLLKNTQDMPEQREQAMVMGAAIAMTNLCLLEYAQHRIAGADAYDALVMTARGDLRLRDQYCRSLAELSNALPGWPKSF